MIVGGVLGSLVIVIAGARARTGALLGEDVKGTRHAKVHEQHVTGGKIGEQIFGPSSDTRNGAPFQARHKILWQRPAQIAPMDLDLDEARAIHSRLKAAANRLDFGKLGHSYSSWLRYLCGRLAECDPV